MISENKALQALHAFNGVLIRLRASVLIEEGQNKTAVVLDILEQLPRFLASEEDQTLEFEAALKELAHHFPEFGIGLERFLRKDAPSSW